MPNTRSAEKALRQSNKRKIQNDYWKKRVKDVIKNVKKYLDTGSLDVAIIKKEESLLYKIIDKASKNNVLHKNKANRIKSGLSKRIAAYEKPAPENIKSKSKSKVGTKSTRANKI